MSPELCPKARSTINNNLRVLPDVRSVKAPLGKTVATLQSALGKEKGLYEAEQGMAKDLRARNEQLEKKLESEREMTNSLLSKLEEATEHSDADQKAAAQSESKYQDEQASAARLGLELNQMRDQLKGAENEATGLKTKYQGELQVATSRLGRLEEELEAERNENRDSALTSCSTQRRARY